jgi:ribosomal peptide maturation radical SAM protein 1
LSSHVLYTNLLLASLTGHEVHAKLCSSEFIGSSLFAPYAFDLDRRATMETLLDWFRAVECDADMRDAPTPEQVHESDGLLSRFLDEATEIIARERPAIVGLASMFTQQNAASVALARRVKEASPGTVVVIGGSAVSSPMGEALLAVAPAVDHVFSGEADDEFPAFCADYVERNTLPASKIIRCAPVKDLDAVESPDYDDYLRQLRRFQAAGLLPATWPHVLFFESSRGCWWGDRCRCAYCSCLPSAAYRQKSRERIVGEVVRLSERHPARLVAAVDNIMPVGLEKTLDELAGTRGAVNLFYEVRSALPSSSLDSLVRGGCVTIQAGIETLSTSLLRRMRKGITGLQNLVFLREAGSRLIDVTWNFLLQVPGEQEADYREMVALLPMIEHFQAPAGWGPVQILRGCPLHDSPDDFGIERVEPVEPYRHLYPAGTDLGSLAFFFSGRYPHLSSSTNALAREFTGLLRRWTRLWKDRATHPRLHLSPTPSGGRVVKDSRSVARQTFTLVTDRALELLELLHRPTRGHAIPDHLRGPLEELVERRFVVRYEDHFLSLVTTPQLGIDLRQRRSASGDARAAG